MRYLLDILLIAQALAYVGLIGKPGVSVTFALEHVFVPLQQRYESGERTDYLHDEMMAVK